MLRWALIFLVIGLIAGLLGFTGVAGASIAIAKTLFFVFIVIFLVLLVLGLTVARKVTGDYRSSRPQELGTKFQLPEQFEGRREEIFSKLEKIT